MKLANFSIIESKKPSEGEKLELSPLLLETVLFSLNSLFSNNNLFWF